MSSKRRSKAKAARDTADHAAHGANATAPHSDLPAAAGRIVVVGDGWSALGVVGFLAAEGRSQIDWVPNSGSRLIAPLPTLEDGPGVAAWDELGRRLGLDADRPVFGSYLREFRNKSFREPYWNKSPTPEDRRAVRDESLWEPERRFAPAFEQRFSVALGDREEAIRQRLLDPARPYPRLTRHENVPLSELSWRSPSAVATAAIEAGRAHSGDSAETADSADVTEISALLASPDQAPTAAAPAPDAERVHVRLGNGVTFDADQVIFADRWAAAAATTGLPRPLPIHRGRDAMGALQVVFTHEPALTGDAPEGFYGAIAREAGEELQRNVFGYVLDGGKRSVWTVFMAHEEGEDNHAIAKRLRRMKQALDKMFAGSAILPEGKAEFTATVASEQVRYEELAVFAAGEVPVEAPVLKGYPHVYFLTDGYGPAAALAQVASLGAATQLFAKVPTELAELIELAPAVDETENATAVNDVSATADLADAVEAAVTSSNEESSGGPEAIQDRDTGVI